MANAGITTGSLCIKTNVGGACHMSKPRRIPDVGVPVPDARMALENMDRVVAIMAYF